VKKTILSVLLGLCALALSGCASKGPAYAMEEIRVKNNMQGVEVSVGFNRPPDPMDSDSRDLKPGEEFTKLVARREGQRYMVFVDGFEKATGRAGKKEFSIYPQNPEPKPGDKERHTNIVVSDLNWYLPAK
jgi:hypothetical protein